MLKHYVKSFLTDTEGGTAVEYGLLLSLISVALVAGLTAFGDSLVNTFGKINDKLDAP